nr:DHHA1 domain-containing protein [uncultured Niameybacter sp.]
MTHQIYYKNSNEMTFEAKVLECSLVKEGYKILLDQTAFFPGGGGQPHDEGTLNGLKVLKILEEGDNIYHIVQEPLEVGQTVKSVVDHRRRRDFMQQHSGEHIVSGIVSELYGYNNVGFSLGEDKMTADFDGILTDEQVAKIEYLANEAVYKNIPICGQAYTKQEVKEIPYRSKKEIEGIIRLVSIEGYDCCACCGVHVEYTGQIGLIKILSADKHRGGTRLTILCGERALKDYQIKHKHIDVLMSHLSLKPYEVVSGVERLLEERNQLKEQVGRLKTQVFQQKIKNIDKNKALCLLESEVTPFDLRIFVNVWMEESSAPCLLLVLDGNTYKYVLGGSKDQISQIAKVLHEQFNGKGGGKEIFQGTLIGEYEEILNVYESLTSCIEIKKEL